MTNRIQGIDPHKSLVLIERAIMGASMRQNEWYIGQTEHHRIEPEVAAVDWSLRYGKDVHKQFAKNREIIYRYVQEHKNEIKLDDKGLPYFSDEQFRILMPQEKNQETFTPKLESLAA